MPIQNPTTAGTNDKVPLFSDCLIAGIRRLQIEAATIIPAANPASARCSNLLSVFLIKNTHAAPSVVPTNGISIPSKIFISIKFPFIYARKNLLAKVIIFSDIVFIL